MFDASVLGGIWQDRAGINQPHVQADDLMISSGRRQFAFGGPELTDCMMIFAFIGKTAVQNRRTTQWYNKGTEDMPD